jgi:UPF0042 nucleotide-binding protein
MSETDPDARRLVLVTGPSGAGRTTALRVLEDLGYEAIDNMPLRMIPALLSGPGPRNPVALGIDPRNRDFSAMTVMDALAQIADEGDAVPELLYLDCTTEVLLRRFSETRRRHPLAEGQRPEAGISRELEILEPLKACADILISTTEMNVHQLREEVERWFSSGDTRRLSVSIESFSYKRGLPRSVDMVFDCRFLKNPFWEPSLRNGDGRDRAVAEYIHTDPRSAPFQAKVRDLALWLLPAYLDEGKSHLSIAFGCTGGQHRSVAMAEQLAHTVQAAGWQVSVRHREMDRREKGEAKA